VEGGHVEGGVARIQDAEVSWVEGCAGDGEWVVCWSWKAGAGWVGGVGWVCVVGIGVVSGCC